MIIAACANPGGIRPQAEMADPASYDLGNAIRAADASAGWPAADWWHAFGDPQLDALVTSATAGSPTLAAAAARVRAANALAGVSAAAEQPRIEGNLSLTRQHWPDNEYYGPGPFANANTWNNTAALRLSYHLDFWGREKNETERALDVAHQRSADARAAQLELEANVVRAYVDFSQQFALLDVATELLARQRQLAALARRRLAGGIGTQLELSQAEAPLPEYERRLESLREAIALARNRLAALAGKGPGAFDSLDRPRLGLAAPQAALPSTLPADLIGHRPDVVAARWAVAAQARGIDVAHAAFYPNVDLIASLGGFAASGPLFQFLHAANGGWTAGPALSLPIFEGGALRERLGVAAAGYDEAVARYDQTVVGAYKDIADAVVRLRSLGAQARDADRSAAAAERSFQLADRGYRRGLTDYVNVIVEETRWLGAKERVAEIRAARLAAYASLMGALGGGLAAPTDGPRAASLAPADRHASAAGAH
ncbi:efflux transporter outer membrane subunit [Trinickia caryophylli]|nr:efflux transporter outer membrane subunit [Trinickia caryophylli]PMS14294.1 RND transporter [Trinickia caryophylli]TRX17752.1 efflux transporter outer membrane subunit [Trinickia caryophylli]WQE11484.1 efflux transporter outer membrane subunit [Trinickia caryophylli]